MTSPSADQIALAIVAAARAMGEDPIEVVQGVTFRRARHVAYAALREAFPEANRAGLARCLAYTKAGNAPPALKAAQIASWWREDLIDEIVGQLVGADYEDEDEPPAAPARESAKPLRVLPFATMHFDRDERKLIASMWNGGANPVTIGAAIGADADQIRLFAKDNPQLCAPERGAA